MDTWLAGRQIINAELVDALPHAKYANLRRAIGQTIQSVKRRGKFIIVPLDGNDELIIHLGMTGIITPQKPEKHLRVVLELSPGINPQLYFKDTRRFGRFLVVPAGDYTSLPTLHKLGVEPLGQDFSQQHFHQQLQRSNTAIKSYLLSQRPVAGVGNIYADEALWASKIHPLTSAKRVSKAKAGKLREAIIKILAASIEAQGTTLNDYRTVNGEVGAYLNELKAYGHDGQACQRCGTMIEKIVVAGRGTHFCPQCQQR